MSAIFIKIKGYTINVNHIVSFGRDPSDGKIHLCMSDQTSIWLSEKERNRVAAILAPITKQDAETPNDEK
jgi:hypothetical protein